MGSEGGSNSSGDESEMDHRMQDFDSVDGGEKKRKPGIIYLSSVPDGMNVSSTTGFFADFGRVGRVFLQPDTKLGMRHFTEGWIEFLSKKIAKRVAAHVNNTPVSGKKNKNNSLWNIKYLPRFKWVHLSERLAYEKAVKQQRMRTEISQVKREAELFTGSVRASKKSKRKREEQDQEEKDGEEQSSAKKKKKEGKEKKERKEEERPFFFQQEVPGGRKSRLAEPKEKKTKKGKKEKEKEEPKSAKLASSSSPNKPKDKKSTKKKKKSGKKTDAPQPTAAAASKPAAKRKSSPRAKKKAAAVVAGGGSGRAVSTRRKSGEGDRAAFLKSVFGGGT